MRDTIIVADKPSIQTRFCFGYGIYNDYDEVVDYGVAVYERDSRGFGVGFDFKI